jgi:hypothetical protein
MSNSNLFTQRIYIRSLLRYARQLCPRGTEFWGKKELLHSWHIRNQALCCFRSRAGAV